MKILTRRLFLYLFAFVCLKALAQVKPAAMSQGVLPNGMHYYIMHNENPKGRASFYFAQHVGSILEKDSQRGLAHFLEHMAFNGTENFPDKQMLKYLEKNGVQFGSEINAFTKYDETVYSIRNVPVQNPKLIDSVLLILHDWSGYLTLKDAEIDNERGVVLEEWRTRYNAQKRAQDSVNELGLLKNSKYADRSPIGLMEVINTFPYDTLRSYYKKWYRPDEQAVIVVGDIDEQVLTQKIKKLFGNIPLRKNLPSRPDFDVPLEDEFIYLTIKDKELRIPSITYHFKHKTSASNTQQQELEEQLKTQMLINIIDSRLIAKADLPESPVYSARASTENVVQALETFKVELQPKKDSLLTSVKWMATELKRFALHGIADKEFDRVKSRQKSNLENRIAEGGSSNVFNAIAIYEAFFKNRMLPDYKWKHQYQLDYLNTIDKKDLIKLFEQYYKSVSKVLAILGSEDLDYPDKTQILSILNQAEISKPLPYQEIVVEDKKLPALDLPGSKIVSKEQLPNLNATRYVLANGAQVYLAKPISPLEGVYFKAVSNGGRSVLPQDLVSNSLYAPLFSVESGLANLTKKQLYRSGEVIMPSVKIEEYQEIIESYTDIDNFEKLTKGVYLTFMQPRFDEGTFADSRQQLERLLMLMNGSVVNQLADSLQMAKTNYNDREVHLNEQLLQELDLSKMQHVYENRINNAADFKFIFMGDVVEERFENLIQNYLGSIPGNSKTEEFVNHDLRPKPGIHKLHLSREMQTPQAYVSLYLTEDLDFNPANNLKMQVIEQLLNKRYMQRIREEEGGSYGVKVNSELKPLPIGTFEITINFNTNPEKVDRLISIVYEELNAITKNIDGIAFAEIKSNLIKAKQEQKDNNQLHFKSLTIALETGITPLSYEDEILQINQLTEEDILKVTKEIMKNPRIVEALLLPASTKQ